MVIDSAIPILSAYLSLGQRHAVVLRLNEFTYRQNIVAFW